MTPASRRAAARVRSSTARLQGSQMRDHSSGGARSARSDAPHNKDSVKIVIESRIDDPGRVEWRREQIVRAAVRCFAVNGYHRTTIKDIADTAGFSTGLIYSYVSDKEDVLFLVFGLIFDTYQREIPRRLEGVTDPLRRFSTEIGRASCRERV